MHGLVGQLRSKCRYAKKTGLATGERIAGARSVRAAAAHAALTGEPISLTRPNVRTATRKIRCESRDELVSGISHFSSATSQAGLGADARCQDDIPPPDCTTRTRNSSSAFSGFGMAVTT